MDLVTDDTAKVWSEMANRDVKIREKLVGVFRTQNEMLALRRDFENKRRSALMGVSTPTVKDDTKCFSLILSRVPLPNLIFTITGDSDVNLSSGRIWKGLLDTGSECSILTMNTVERSGLSSNIKPCKMSITLTGATGSKKHPFLGELSVMVRFLCTNHRFSSPVKRKFYVSSSIQQNILGSDLIAALEGNISYKRESFTFKTDQGVNFALLVAKNDNMVLRNLDSIDIGVNAIRFSCSKHKIYTSKIFCTYVGC